MEKYIVTSKLTKSFDFDEFPVLYGEELKKKTNKNNFFVISIF